MRTKCQSWEARWATRVAGLLVVFGVVSARAAELLYEIPGSPEFGWAVANVGDLDGDTVADFAVGAPGTTITDPEARSGAVFVYSGATGSPVGSFVDGMIVGDPDAVRFGSSVAGVGDVDGDGTPDIVVGAIGGGRIGSAPGYVAVHSGADGTQIRRIDGLTSAASFGRSVAGVGDVTGDGTPDVLVGEPGTTGAFSGNAYLFDGGTGAMVSSFAGADGADNLGWSVAGIGDATGDGTPDFAIGAPGALRDDQFRPRGRVLIVSGAGSEILKVLTGRRFGDQLGYAVAGVGDIDGSGRTNVAATARGYQLRGGAFVFDDRGKIRLTIRSPFDSGFLGSGIAGIRDVSGDGLPDVVIGADSLGLVAVVAGRGGFPQFTHFASPNDLVGAACADAGDLNGDGVPDLIVGAWGADAVRVFALDQGTPPGKLKWKLAFDGGPAAGGATGKATITGTPKKSLFKLLFTGLAATPPYAAHLETAVGSGVFFEVASVEPKPNGKAKIVLKSKVWPPGALRITSLADLAGRRLELRDATGAAVLTVIVPAV